MQSPLDLDTHTPLTTFVAGLLQFIKVRSFHRRGKKVPRRKHKDVDSACLAFPKVTRSDKHRNCRIIRVLRWHSVLVSVFLPLLLPLNKTLATQRQFAHLGYVPFCDCCGGSWREVARATSWCWERARVGVCGAGLGDQGGQAVTPLSYSLLPITSQHGLETDSHRFSIFHIVLLLLEDQFLFCFTKSYTAMF